MTTNTRHRKDRGWNVSPLTLLPPPDDPGEGRRQELILRVQTAVQSRDKAIDTVQWIVGDAARAWADEELGTLEECAIKLGMKPQYIRACKSVADKFPAPKNRKHNVRWTLYQTAATLDDPNTILKQAEAENWTRGRLRQYIASVNQEILEPGEQVEPGTDPNVTRRQRAARSAKTDGDTIDLEPYSNDAGGPGGVALALQGFVSGATYNKLREAPEAVANAMLRRGIGPSIDDLQALADFCGTLIAYLMERPGADSEPETEAEIDDLVKAEYAPYGTIGIDTL